LPAEVQNYTSYSAAPMSAAANTEPARSLVRYLGSAEAKALLAAAVSISIPERMRLVALLLSCAVADAAAAADIRVLAAAALEPGLVKVADQFKRETNNRVRFQFAAGPLLERRLSQANRPMF